MEKRNEIFLDVWEIGYWSRRINDKDRLIYKIDENNIYILACRYHYGDK